MNAEEFLEAKKHLMYDEENGYFFNVNDVEDFLTEFAEQYAESKNVKFTSDDYELERNKRSRNTN